MLSIAKPIKIKVLLHQFSLLMFNLHYMFLFTVFLPDRGIAALPHFFGKCRTIQPKGSQGRKEGKQTKKNKMPWELSFRHAYYLVRVVRVAWPVYVRTYCVPTATLNQNKRSRLLYLGDAQVKRDVRQHFKTVQIRTIATTATNMLECKKGANFSIVCTYF